MDCLRRSRSSNRKPPAERRLKNATPSSQASTSQGRASSEGDRREKLDEVVATTALVARGRVCALGEPFAGVAALELVRKKNVPIGAASINTSAPTAST